MADAPMLDVFSHAGFETQMTGATGTVRVRFPIAATPELRERIDARDHEAVRRSMEPLLAPRSVAVSAPRRGADRSAVNSSATCWTRASPGLSIP